MTVTNAKNPVLCVNCGHVILIGQLMSNLNGPAHVDCSDPNRHREWPDWVARPTLTAGEPPITERLGDSGRVRVHHAGHVAEGVLTPSGPDSFTFTGHMVCGPHDADGVHLVAADQEESTVQHSSGPGAGQPIRNSSTERRIMTKTSADPMPWVHQGYRSANEWEPANPHGDRTHGLWRPRPEFEAVEATTLWKCTECGDVMPAGFGEDDHLNCNHPEDFPVRSTSTERES